MKLQGNHSPAEQDLTSCQAAMSCLVLADGLRESVGGHTKMDIKLLEVSSMTIRFDEKNCCEGHTCQGEGGSEFKRLQNLLIIL